MQRHNAAAMNSSGGPPQVGETNGATRNHPRSGRHRTTGRRRGPTSAGRTLAGACPGPLPRRSARSGLANEYSSKECLLRSVWNSCPATPCREIRTTTGRAPPAHSTAATERAIPLTRASIIAVPGTPTIAGEHLLDHGLLTPLLRPEAESALQCPNGVSHLSGQLRRGPPPSSCSSCGAWCRHEARFGGAHRLEARA